MARATVKSIPAPVGGLNARDGIANMPPTDAIVLDNWFPTPSTVNLRNGSVNLAKGLGANVETLATYNSATTSTLFAAAGGNIFDVTAGGQVGPAVVTGLTSARWQDLNFGSTAANGQFLYLFNGVDSPLVYTGSQWQVVASTSTAQSINSATNNGATATVTTAAAHGLATGNFVIISGATPAAYNGSFAVTVTSATTFTIALRSDPGGSATAVGTYLISPAITGVDPRLLVQAVSFKQRIYMVEKDSCRCWYLPVNALGGTAQALDFGGMFKLGGYLMAVCSWSVDNSAGLQEFFVAVSSEGEIAVYQGYDPTNAENWSVASHFRVGRPVGRRCFTKVGSDVVFLSADGAYPLSKAMLTDRSQQNNALSQKIQNLINTDVQLYAANFGWQVILYPIGNKIIINVPSMPGFSSYQYVMNTITGAWCRFTGWNALCWALFKDKLIFGAPNGFVYQADVGLSDNGAAIVADGLQAFNYFDVQGQKQFTGIRPLLYASRGIAPACQINIDFDTSSPTAITSNSISITLWGSAWGSPWSTNNGTIRNWQGAGGIGYAGAPHMVVSSKNAVCQWQGTDVMFQPCGPTL
jgi:hypothetical protein